MPGKKIRTKGLLKKNITPFFVPVFCRSISVDTSFYKYIAGKNSYAGEYDDWDDASMVLLDLQGDDGNEAGTSVDLEVAYRLLLTLNNYNSVNIESTLSNQKSLDKTISKIAENHISRLYSKKASDYLELRSILKEIRELETLKLLPARKLTKKLRGQIDSRSDKVKNTILKQLTLLEKGTNNNGILQTAIQGRENVSSAMSVGYSRIISQHQSKYISSLFQQHENRAFLYSRGQTSAEYKAYSYSNTENTLSYNNEKALTYNTSSRESSQSASNILQLYGYKTEFISPIEKAALTIKKAQTAGDSGRTEFNWLQLIEESTFNILKQQVSSGKEVYEQKIEKYHESLIKEERIQKSYKDTVLRNLNERVEKFITVNRGIPEVRIPAFRQTDILQILPETAGLLSSTQSAVNGFTENTVYGTSEYTQMVLKQVTEQEKRLTEEKLVNYIQREKTGNGKNVLFHSIIDRLGRFITVYAGKTGDNLMLCEVKKLAEHYMQSNTVYSTVLELKHNESVNLHSQTVLDKRVNSAQLKSLGNDVFQGIAEYFEKKVSLHKGPTTVIFLGNSLHEEFKETFWRNFSKSTELVKTEKSIMFQRILEKIEDYRKPIAFNGVGSLKASAVQSQSLYQINNEKSPEVVLNSFSDMVLSPVKFSMINRKEEGMVKEIIEKRTFGFIRNIYKNASPVLQNILKQFNGSLFQHNTWSVYNNENTTQAAYTANNSELTLHKESKYSEAINKIIEESINETIINKTAVKDNSYTKVKEYSPTALFERVLQKNDLWILKNFSNFTKSVRNFSNNQISREYLGSEKNIVNLKKSTLNTEMAYYTKNTDNQLLSQITNLVSGQIGRSMAENRYINSFDSKIASNTFGSYFKNNILNKSINDAYRLESNSYVFAKNEVINNQESSFASDKWSMAGKSLENMKGTLTNVFEKNIFKEIINRKQFTEMIHNHGVKNEIEYSKGFTAGADIEHVKKVSHKNNEQLELQEKTIKGLTRKLEAQGELVKNLYQKQNIKTEKPVDIRDITNNVMRQLQKELRLERQRRGLE